MRCHCEGRLGAKQSGPLGRPEHGEGSHQAETRMRPPRFARGDCVGLLRHFVSRNDTKLSAFIIGGSILDMDAVEKRDDKPYNRGLWMNF